MTNERGGGYDDFVPGALTEQEADQEAGDAVIWCNGMCAILSAKGLMEGHNALTAKGQAAFDALRASGFVPLKDAALAYLDGKTGNHEASEAIFAKMMKENNA